jgi:hypothetical protein
MIQYLGSSEKKDNAGRQLGNSQGSIAQQPGESSKHGLLFSGYLCHSRVKT